MSYRRLQIWQEARELSIKVHEMSLALPRFEQIEQASQIRRSSKSVRSNIVEGYSRRKYKKEFIRFLIYSIGSCDETRDHLEMLFETGSLKDKQLFESLSRGYEQLCKKLINFLKAVEESHNMFEG